MSRKRLSTYTAPPTEVTRALDELRARYEVPTAFPPEALAEAEATATSWAQDGPARLLADGARDARDLDLVTIDPPGSMDLDQAVLLERLPARSEAAGASVGDAPGSAATYRVHYAIASLATFVPPGGALDAELGRRGETIYAPDAATPLHPEVLSHGAASLLEDVDRPACLWTIDLDARLKTKKDLEARYQELLKRANSVDEVLKVEAQISSLRAEIESAEGQMRYLKNQVALSTLAVSFYEKTVAAGFGYKFQRALRQGWDNLLWVIVGLANLWAILLFVAIVWIIIARIRRNRKRKKAAASQS